MLLEGWVHDHPQKWKLSSAEFLTEEACGFYLYASSFAAEGRLTLTAFEAVSKYLSHLVVINCK